MNTEFWISKRYLRSTRKQRFLPLMTFVSIAGISIGIIALITILSVMRGGNEVLEKKLMGLNAHVTIVDEGNSDDLTADKIHSLIPEYVKNISHFIQGETIARSKTGDEVVATGIRVKGVSEEDIKNLRDVEFYFAEDSSLNSLSPSDKSSLSGIILGDELLSQLNVHPDFGDKIDLIAPLAQVGPTGELEPIARTYKLIGSFRSGFYEYDSRVAFVSFREGEKLLGLQGMRGWQITLNDPYKIKKVVEILKQSLGSDLRIESWDRENRKLFAALKLERWAMGIVLFLIVLIASFSIIGLVMMLVFDKKKDVAILRTIGMNIKDVRKIFLLYSVQIGAVGSILGGILGSILCFVLMIRPIKLPGAYYLDTLPVKWSFFWSLVFVLLGVFVAALSSLYPVSQSTNEDLVVTLRYE
ncbi:MAG: hypothetical protein COS89_07310 [Deltaproteobacteria bacterium CG07_land_8_20_14_0_80_38_7]|nr:MAG: hypothetical protein COS89_07310 [Deltaproteobacteria bacterium CG07_land_8_20_14_0_80_38_7]